MAVKDLSGQRFGRLVAVEHVGFDNRRNALWNCRCDCGTEKTVAARCLGRTTNSCGCLAREALPNLKHGLSRSPEYKTWLGMKRRCKNHNHKAFQHYGARGIRVCARWESFENFFADMGRRPSPKHEIERLDNDGNYEPLNCCWVTRAAQAKNRRDTNRVTFRGKTLCLTEWSRRLNIDNATLRYRIRRWGVERAFTTPVAAAKKICWQGRSASIHELSLETRINEGTLRGRLRSGWAVYDALTRPVRPKRQTKET